MTGPFIRATRAVATWQAAHPGIYTPECIADLVSEMQREMSDYGEECAALVFEATQQIAAEESE